MYKLLVPKTKRKELKMKDRTTAGMLALFIGGMGLHHFYLNEKTAGSASSAVKSLQDYICLYENGLITQEEYDTLREKVLRQLGM